MMSGYFLTGPQNKFRHSDHDAGLNGEYAKYLQHATAATG